MRFVINHPLAKHHLARLREKSTAPDEFRSLIRRLATLLAYEATQDLLLKPTLVETPLTQAAGEVLQQRVGLVPILRAGLGMVDPILDLLPTAEVWHLGFYRDEATAQPVEYYSNLAPSEPVDVGLVIDPMLATGGSAVAALASLKRWGVPQTKLLSIIASEEGVRHVEQHHPQTQIYVCVVDPQLNTEKFIVPGLGDAGDRLFNTLRS